MGSRFFVIYCHDLVSRACPALPVGFVIMFLLMLMTAASQWLHNFSTMAKRRKMMHHDYSMVSLYWCTMQRLEKA